MKATVSVSIGKSGGFYLLRQSGVYRLCLGPLAFTYWPWDIDEKLKELLT